LAKRSRRHGRFAIGAEQSAIVIQTRSFIAKPAQNIVRGGSYDENAGPTYLSDTIKCYVENPASPTDVFSQ
jgi:hypothetical protein